MTTRSVSVVLPCLNEADSVGDVVREAAAALASAGARVVHERRRGYGAAYLAGFRAATGDVIVMADADNTYDLSALPAFLARIGGGDDLVMGSRFKGHMEAGAMPALHRFGSPILSGLLNVLYGTGVDDAHCGMRAFKREALERMQLRMQGMEFASEMIVNAARAGWRHLRFLILYSPTHLFVWPGAVLFTLGVALLVALAPGPLRIAGYYLDIHFMVLGLLLALVGFQTIAIGLYAKTLAVALRIQPVDRTLRALEHAFTLERGLVVGSVLFLVGLAVDIAVAAEWLSSGLGPLNEVRRALIATAAMLLGMQIAFASLFLSAIDLQTRDH